MGEPKIISVEGLIGVGKSTFVKDLAEHLGYVALMEPVSEHPYLERFYEDPKRWAFPMQIDMMTRRHEIHRHATWAVRSGKIKGAVIDRSIWGDSVFANLNHRIGNIDDHSKATYDRLFETLTTDIAPMDEVIHLDASVATCMDRIARRSRDGECAVSEDYMSLLDHELAKRLFDVAGGYFDPDERNEGGCVFMVDWDEFGDVADAWEYRGI